MFKIGDKVYVRYIEGQVFEIVALRGRFVKLRRVCPMDVGSITFEVTKRDITTEIPRGHYEA